MNFDTCRSLMTNFQIAFMAIQNDPRFNTAMEFGRFADDIFFAVVPGLLSIMS